MFEFRPAQFIESPWENSHSPSKVVLKYWINFYRTSLSEVSVTAPTQKIWILKSMRLKDDWNNINGVLLVSLLLTLNVFQILF